MRFDIEKLLQFDTDTATLVNKMTGDSIELSLTSTRLFAKLLSHHKDILSREEIFQSVFDDYGARSSNSNLNQYISILRKNIIELGIEQEVIVTVPRVGFRISENIAVNSSDEKNSIPPLPEFTPKKEPERKFFITHYSLIVLFTTIVFLFIFFRPENLSHDNNIKTIKIDKCVIYTSSSISDRDIESIIDKATQHTKKLNCSTEKEIFIDKLQIKSTLGTNNQILFIECSLSNNKCLSYYFREKENA